MKHSRLIPILVVVALLLPATACGSAEPIIETAAAEMNLSAADLGGDWALASDQGVDEIADISEGDVLDANMRMFASDGMAGMIMSIVFSTESVTAAKQEMKGDAVQNLGAGLQAQLPGATFETLDPPAVGDEVVMAGANYADLQMNVYMVTFRKTNVIAMLMVMGTEDEVTEDLAVSYAQKFEAKIQ